jgi:poly-gamma-glutamate synthesis protein (capsule biosynthesis protein)
MLAAILALCLMPACTSTPAPEPTVVKLTSATPTELRENNPAPSPTSLPARAWILGVPTSIAVQAEQALDALLIDHPEWDVQLEPGQPAVPHIEAGDLDLAIVPDAAGFHVWEQPIALAVPLTSEWEDLSFDQAQAILGSGSPFIAALPWSEMTPDLRALRVDGVHPAEPGYPLLQPWSLHARTAAEDVARALAPLLEMSLMEEEAVQIAAVGDVMLDRTIGQVLTAGDLGFPFQHVLEPLQRADLTVGNLESALGEGGEAEAKGYTFLAPPAAAQSLAGAGFDLMSIANNHAMDFGPDQLLRAIEILEEAGIRSVGGGIDKAAAHAPVVFTSNDLSIAFLAYVAVPQEYRGFDARAWEAGPNKPGLAWAEPAQIRIDVAAAAQMYDAVVVLLHSGYENVAAPSGEQRLAAHTAIQAGAALVLGHHAHLLQGVELYRGGVIAYGLGNFAFEDAGPPESGILRIWLDADGVRAFDLLPVMLDEFGVPRPVHGEQAAAIQAIFLERTRSLAVNGQ